jgi:hypothetical protein
VVGDRCQVAGNNEPEPPVAAGKQHGDHNMLVKIYGWFTEGFNTKDLYEAKALLEELAGE